MYHIYSQHKTQELAEVALADYFASDIVSEGEFPKIEKQRRVARDQTALYRTVYCVMFRG